MKYQVVVNRKGRRMYYGTPEGQKKRLISVDDIPVNVLEELTPENPYITESEKVKAETTPVAPVSDEFRKMREESEGTLSDDTSVRTKPKEEKTTGVLDSDLLVDEEDYIEDKKDPTPEVKKMEEQIPLYMRGCLFGHKVGDKIKRVNMTTVYLCDVCYHEKTPGKIVEQINKMRKAEE